MRQPRNPPETLTPPLLALTVSLVAPLGAGCRPTGRLCAHTTLRLQRTLAPRAGVGGEERSRLRPVAAESGVGSIRADRSFRLETPTPPHTLSVVSEWCQKAYGLLLEAFPTSRIRLI